jgi:hypothetical protein
MVTFSDSARLSKIPLIGLVKPTGECGFIASDGNVAVHVTTAVNPNVECRACPMT